MMRKPRADGRTQFNVYVLPEVAKRLRHQAVEEETSYSAVAEKAIVEYLNRQEESR
jgi:predicted transcriptional regulator